MQLKTMDIECRKHTKVEKYVLPHAQRVGFIAKKEKNRYQHIRSFKFLFFNKFLHTFLLLSKAFLNCIQHKLYYCKVEIPLCKSIWQSSFSIQLPQVRSMGIFLRLIKRAEFLHLQLNTTVVYCCTQRKHFLPSHSYS